MTEEQQLIEEKYGGRVRAEDEAAFAADQARLASGEPLAYVIGWQPFLGLRIFLDSKPLIPRPETEWIAEKLIAGLATHSAAMPAGEMKTAALHALDLCAGSGAIGCALLAQVPDVRVSFGELMPAHEATIRKNLVGNGLATGSDLAARADARADMRADVRIGDLFAPFVGEKFDIIVSNPPYIPDERALDDSVALHEPAEALRGGPDGLGLVRRIAREAPAHLNPGGELWLEVDAEHAEAARAIVAAALRSAAGGRAELYPDPYGRPRLVVGHYA